MKAGRASGSLRASRHGDGSGTIPYEFRQLVVDTLMALDAWSVDRCSIVGYSMGGCVAQFLAGQHAERVARLVFVSSGYAATMRLGPSARQRELLDVPAAQDATDEQRLAKSLMDQWAVLHGVSSGFDPQTWSSRVWDWIAWGYNARCPHVKLGPQVFGVDRSAALGSISAPALVAHGDDDPMFPIEHGRVLAEALPNARLLSLAGRRHELFAAPDVHQLIVDHLTRPDFLVEFESGSSLFDLVHLEDDLEERLGFSVDVVSVGGLKSRDEHIRRDAVAL